MLGVSNEVWALAGVIVGAILGGGAQILAGWLQRRHERAAFTRQCRREAYANMLGALLRVRLDEVWAGPLMQKLIQQGMKVPTVADNFVALMAALAEVSLVAPMDTTRAASLALTSTLDSAAKGTEKKGLDEFTTFAKRDLGIKS